MRHNQRLQPPELSVGCCCLCRTNSTLHRFVDSPSNCSCLLPLPVLRPMDSCAGAPPASAPCSEPHFQSRCPAGGPAGCSHVGTNPVRRDNATVLRFRHNPKTSTPLLPQIGLHVTITTEGCRDTSPPCASQPRALGPQLGSALAVTSAAGSPDREATRRW